MNSSNGLVFKLSRVFGLPTGRGLTLMGLMIVSLGYTVAYHSVVEQWLASLMFLFLFLHLLELNQQFGSLRVTVLPGDPVFAEDAALIPVLLLNPGPMSSEKLGLKLEGSPIWTETAGLSEQETRIVNLPFYPKKQGKQALPRLRVRMRSASGLFQLWVVIQPQGKLSILPRPVNHQIAVDRRVFPWNDFELSHLELIRDLRRMPEMDQKLFQKTGLPYRRVYESRVAETEVFLNWDRLDYLEEGAKAEQFAFWVKAFEEVENSGIMRVEIRAPFYHQIRSHSRVLWGNLKKQFASWLDAKDDNESS